MAIQDPVKLNERSEPKPDIAVVKIDPLDYADHHPTPTEIYLIIEVADSSVNYHTLTFGTVWASQFIGNSL
jgi:Uma2 family endonuclease